MVAYSGEQLQALGNATVTAIKKVDIASLDLMRACKTGRELGLSFVCSVLRS